MVTRKLRMKILERDNFSCQDCGISPINIQKLHIHHIKPVRIGGSDNPDNLVTLCPRCHSQRPEDYIYLKNKLVSRQKFGFHTSTCETCGLRLQVKDAMLFCGDVALLMECPDNHQVIILISKERFSTFGQINWVLSGKKTLPIST